MDAKGGLQDVSSNGQVLHWQGRLLCAEDLRRALNGHRELILSPRTVVTPLAAEELRSRGVQLTRQEDVKQPGPAASWGYTCDRPEPVVQSAVKSLERDGAALKELRPPSDASLCRWAAAVAKCVAKTECKAGIVFCQDAGLLCCVANKFAGLRAVPVASAAQAARATRALGANLIAIEVAGRTFFEIRQILRTVCVPGEPACPAEVACTLQELEGHAHR
ncbi:MAG TPA: RpiB/LacA/LacB family sugar-phosphate isomerase [Gemmataceae bacterium]|jgi:ribose 5-phosphate isomerase RpiB|nr:RpiB/LacA/LacB family sugar-phosphate isomerase [Gemmataceae bacterium]